MCDSVQTFPPASPHKADASLDKLDDSVVTRGGFRFAGVKVRRGFDLASETR
jgi:hypothetical protein